MNKRTIFLAVSFMIVGFSLAHGAHMSPMEVNIDRPGGDYLNLELNLGNCQLRCASEGGCMAWNYDPRHRRSCFLKNSFPEAVRSPGLVSGVKIFCATMGARINNIDFLDGDSRNFPLPTPDPTVCENECALDLSCTAWNYDPRHGPHCYLKDKPFTVVSSPGLISGQKISSQCTFSGMNDQLETE